MKTRSAWAACGCLLAVTAGLPAVGRSTYLMSLSMSALIALPQMS